MKALHLIGGGDSGGAKTHVLTLLRELNRDQSAALLCLGDGVLAQEARQLGLPCRVAEGFLAGLRIAEELCRDGEISVLHCHGARANLTGALLRGRVPCPVVSTVHSDWRRDYLGRPAARLVYGTLNALALRRMDALTCVSSAMAGLCRERGIPSEKLYYLYNGIPHRRPASSVSREAWREQYGIPSEAVVVATAARLDKVKDLPTLLRGFARAAASDERLRLVIAGAGREEASLRGLADTLGLRERVRFLGWVEDPESLLGASDIFALTSRYETFPFVLLSAGRAGLPVTASAVGGIPELIRDGETGFLFAPGCPEELGAALQTLAGDAALRARLGEALRQETRLHTPEAMAARQKEIYEILTQTHKKENKL